MQYHSHDRRDERGSRSSAVPERPKQNKDGVRVITFLSRLFPEKACNGSTQECPKVSANTKSTKRNQVSKPNKAQECKCIIAAFFGDKKTKNKSCGSGDASKKDCLVMSLKVFKSLPVSTLKAIVVYLKLDPTESSKLKKKELLSYVIKYLPREYRMFSRSEFVQ